MRGQLHHQSPCLVPQVSSAQQIRPDAGYILGSGINMAFGLSVLWALPQANWFFPSRMGQEPLGDEELSSPRVVSPH